LRGYSGFDSALYRKLDAKWHFSQENATLHDFKMATVKSKTALIATDILAQHGDTIGTDSEVNRKKNQPVLARPSWTCCLR
jgi:hypothetical protein